MSCGCSGRTSMSTSGGVTQAARASSCGAGTEPAHQRVRVDRSGQVAHLTVADLDDPPGTVGPPREVGRDEPAAERPYGCGDAGEVGFPGQVRGVRVRRHEYRFTVEPPHARLAVPVEGLEGAYHDSAGQRVLLQLDHARHDRVQFVGLV